MSVSTASYEQRISSLLAGHDPDTAVSKLLSALDRLSEERPQIGLTELSNTLWDAFIAGQLPWAVSNFYRSLMTSVGRLPPGIVFTPPWLAEALVDRLEPGRTVVDLGAGTGLLTLAAAARGYEVVAVESNRQLAAILESLVRVLGFREQVKLVQTNALSWKGTHGSQVISNPPYTRHQLMSETDKAETQILCSTTGVPLSRSASLYTFFMAVALSASWSMNEVFVVPTNWLEARYGRPLKSYLLEHFSVSIDVFHGTSRAMPFGDSLATTCIVHSSKGSGDRQSILMRTITEDKAVDDWVTTDLSHADPEDNWLAIHLARESGNVPDGIRLGDVFAVHRGLATGSNEYFLFSPERARAAGIDTGELVQVVRSLAATDRRNDRNLLWVPTDPPSQASAQYIQRGVATGVNCGYLCSRRSPWWRIVPPSPAPILLTCLWRKRPLLAKNGSGAVNLNNLHGLIPLPNSTRAVVDAAFDYLLSDEGKELLCARARHLGGGLLKLEPGDVEDIILPL